MPSTNGGVMALKRHMAVLEHTAALPDWWPDLFERADGASIFLSPAWVQTWLEVYGHEFSGFWLRWESGGEIVGGCLILTRTVRLHHLPLATLFINTTGTTSARSPATEFNQVLHVSCYEAAIATDLARTIVKHRWNRLSLSCYEDCSLARSVLENLPVSGLDREEQPAPYVDLSVIANHDYEATLSGKTRSQIRRCRRMYEQALGPVVIEAAADCEQALAFLDELAVLHNATWSSRGLPGAFACPEYMDFHHRLIRRLWPLRGVDVLRARAGDKHIGYVYNFMLRGKVYCVQTGLAREEDNHLKPGMLTHALAIRYYCDKGYREYDFLAGDMRYKRSLANSQRTLVWSVAYRRSAYMGLMLLARSAYRRVAALRRAPSGKQQEAADDGLSVES